MAASWQLRVGWQPSRAGGADVVDCGGTIPDVGQPQDTDRRDHSARHRVPRCCAARAPVPKWLQATNRDGKQRSRNKERRQEGTKMKVRSLLAASVASVVAGFCIAHAQDMPEGRLYTFHSSAQHGCPALDWHVVVGAD